MKITDKKIREMLYEIKALEKEIIIKKRGVNAYVVVVEKDNLFYGSLLECREHVRNIIALTWNCSQANKPDPIFLEVDTRRTLTQRIDAAIKTFKNSLEKNAEEQLTLF